MSVNSRTPSLKLLITNYFLVVRMRGDAEKAKAVYKGTTPLVAEDVAEIIVFNCKYINIAVN